MGYGERVSLFLEQVLVVHGGLFSQDGVTLDDIRAIDRNMCAIPSIS